MKQKVRTCVLLCILLLLCVCAAGIGICGRNAGKTGQGLMGCAHRVIDNKKKPCEPLREILEKGTVLLADNAFEFYRTDSEEIDGEIWSLDKDYIAVHDLRDDFYIYLPDSYEIILDIGADASGIAITYTNEPDYIIREVFIPICFPARMEGIVGMDFHSERHIESGEEWNRNDIREVCSGEEALEDTVFALPHEVWREEISMEDKTCEITFERISPIYRRLHSIEFERMADYRLTVRDEGGIAVCEQIFMNFPAAFEETFWIADFSGDGCGDIAFCTGENHGTGSHNTYFRILIWNAGKSRYEKKYLPETEVYGNYFTGFPLWNEEQQVLMAAVGTDKWEGAVYEMYSYENGEWQRIRRLENAYSETEFYEMPREKELYPAAIGYWELFYEDGKEIGKNFVELKKGSVWSSDNGGNLKLYPDSPEWEKVSVSIDGLELYKEVKNSAYREPEAIYEYVKNFDFTVREYPINPDFYGSRLEQEYKEAFYDVIANRVPVRYEDDGAVYFRDMLRGVSGMSDGEFVEYVENEKDKYRFIDYDGDGFPELAMDLDIDGVCIWKYLPEEKRAVLYYGLSEGSRLLGSNRIGSYVPSGAGLTRYRYVFEGDAETKAVHINFEAQYYEEEVTYTVSVWGDDLEGSVSVDEKQWEELKEPFLYAMNHPVSLVSFEEAFGGDFIPKQESDISQDEIEKIYMGFLEGKRSAGNVSIDTIWENVSVEALFDETIKPEEGTLQYLIYDTDADGLPELHIRAGNTYYAIVYRNGKLFVWFTEDYKQNQCYEVLESGELLYRSIQDGNAYFCCARQEASSNRDIRMDFKWEDSNGNGICDEDDLYQYNDAKGIERYSGTVQDRTCSMKEWMDKTQEYISVREDGAIEILHIATWNVYGE